MATTQQQAPDIEMAPPSEKNGLEPMVSQTGTTDMKEGEIKDLDQAEIFLRNNNITHDDLNLMLDDEAGIKKLVKKVDWTIMPLLCGTYLLQYIDKQSLSYAAVFDLFESTNTNQSQYSWLVSIFYFGYLVAEWPSSYLAQKFPTGTIISVAVICWGSILMIMAGCHNFTGLAICRFLLGCFESLITPVFMMIVGQWYIRKEQSSRAGLFYCFNGVGASVGGILFFGVGQSKGFDVWRTIFILAGGLTVCWGVVMLFFLPNNIMTAKRFLAQEKATLIARAHQNQTGVFSSTIKLDQVKEALVDPQIWILFCFVLLNETVNGGLANFSKLIIKGLANGDAILTTAYGIPTGVWQVFFVFSGPWLASKFKNIRTFIMPLYVCPTIIATALLWKVPHTAEHNKGLLICNYIAGAYVASLVIALQLPANNVGGYTKRVTSTALVFLAYCAGNIIGPHAFLEREAPTYQTGCTVTMACAAGQVALSFVLRFVLIRRNKKRDALYCPAPEGSQLIEGAIEDRTDFNNPNFRYSCEGVAFAGLSRSKHDIRAALTSRASELTPYQDYPYGPQPTPIHPLLLLLDSHMMLDSIVRFADDTAGLEKALRLLQSFCTIGIGLWVEEIEFWTRARSQFALGRRYFRLLKWHPCWSNAFSAFGQDRNPVETLLDVGKWSFLGIYFFLEMLTISNAMGLTAYEWGPKVQREANKCWFYALVLSILLSLYQLLLTQAPLAEANGKVNGSTDEKKKISKTEPKQRKIDQNLLSQLLIDSCDLFIPGAAVGWIPAGMITVGTASTISTTIAGHQIWNRVQQKAQQS